MLFFPRRWRPRLPKGLALVGWLVNQWVGDVSLGLQLFQGLSVWMRCGTNWVSCSKPVFCRVPPCSAEVPEGEERQWSLQDLPLHPPAGLVGPASSVLPDQKHEKPGFNKAAGRSACVPGTGQTASPECLGAPGRFPAAAQGDNKEVAPPSLKKLAFP